MIKIQNPKQYDLEERTFEFAKRIRAFVNKLSKTITNIEDSKQLTNASGSVGANYIEANESLSKKDFVMRIKICRKEVCVPWKVAAGFILRSEKSVSVYDEIHR